MPAYASALGASSCLHACSSQRGVSVADSFAHLHVHTEFSMLDGAARVKDLVQAVAADGQRIFTGDTGFLWSAPVQSKRRFLIPFTASVEHSFWPSTSSAEWTPEAEEPSAIRSIHSASISPDGSTLLFSAGWTLWRQSILDVEAVPERVSSSPVSEVAHFHNTVHFRLQVADHKIRG